MYIYKAKKAKTKGKKKENEMGYNKNKESAEFKHRLKSTFLYCNVKRIFSASFNYF